MKTRLVIDIENAIRERLKEEARQSRLTMTEIVEYSLKMYFLSVDKKRKEVLK